MELLLPAPANADVTTASITSLTQFLYEVQHMPDLDQKRATGPGVLGLPGDGSMYCVPTGSMNILMYIANHGFPEVVPPGPGNWQSMSNYNPATLHLFTLGNAMNTDAANGTGGDGWVQGLKSRLDPYHKFTVNSTFASGSYSPTFTGMSVTAIFGSLVAFSYGRYQILVQGANDSLTLGDRTGGHVVTLSKAMRNGGVMTLGCRNPADGDSDLLAQSIFGNTIYNVRDHTVFVGGDTRTMSSIAYPQDDGLVRLIDGVVAVIPKAGYSLTNDHRGIHYVQPLGFTGTDQPTTFDIPSPAGAAIRDLARHPELHSFFVITEESEGRPPALHLVNILTRESAAVDLGVDDLDLVATGRKAGVVYFHNIRCEILCYDVQNGFTARGQSPFPPQAMTYDDAADELVLLSISNRKLMRWNAELRGSPRTFDIPSTVALSGEGEIAVNPLDGKVWVLSEATSALFGLSENPPGTLEVEQFADRAIENPAGLDFDDAGHLFVSSGGGIVEFAPLREGGWELVNDSDFARVAAGPKLHITRSRTNYDPAVHNFPPPYNILPEETLSGRFEPDLTFLRGDCNGDGEVTGTVTDAVFHLQFNFIGGPRPRCLAACDANGDGQVTGLVTDAVYTLQYNFLGGPPPLAPFPECGPATLRSDSVIGCEEPQACR